MAQRKKNNPLPKGPYYFPQGAVGQVDRSLLPTSSIDSFEDVDITNPQTGDYFRYDGASWTNEAISQVLTDLKTVDGSGSGLDADLLDSYEASAFPRKLETATIPGQWTFTQDPYVSNGAFTGYINFDSASEAADHNAVFLLRDSGGQPIWRFYKRTDKNLALMRGSGPTMVWEADVTTGKVDFNQIPTSSGTDIMLVGDPPTAHTHTESEITDGKYRLFRRDGFVAMTARETLHLTGGNQIDITATDDAGNDETDITIAVNETGLNADTLDTYHASAFPRITNTETITGTWTFDKVITLNGATTGQKKVLFDAADLSFTRNMGWEFSHGGTGYLHKSQIEITSGDFIWQSYVSAAWKNVLEIKTADGVVDFNERPTWDGSGLALTSEITGDSYYSEFRRDGFTAMTQRTTMHWTGGAGIDITAADDAGNDETDITIAVDSTVPLLTADETVTGSWTFNDNQIYVENGAYTGFLNYGSTVDSADHTAIWSLENAASQRIWSMQKSATTTNLRLNRTASNTKVWEIGLTTGIMDFNEIPTVDGVDIPTVGATTITGTWTFNADTYVDNGNLYIREPADTARVKLQRANGTLSSPTAVSSGNWIGDHQFYGYDGAGYDLVATIRARASEGFTASLHGTDLLFYATPDGHATQEIIMLYDATAETFDFETINGVRIDSPTATLEIQSAADAKIILRDDGTAAWNRIDFYELTNRHGYLGFDTANEFLIVNEETTGAIRLQTTNNVAITVSDDAGTTENRIASISAIVDTGTPSGTPTYGAMYMVY